MSEIRYNPYCAACRDAAGKDRAKVPNAQLCGEHRDERIATLEDAIRFVLARNRLTPADHDRLAALLGDK